MAYKFNVFTGALDIISRTSFVTLVTTNPIIANDGDMIYNLTSNKLEIWFNNTWNIVGSSTGGGGGTTGTFTFIDGSGLTFIDGSFVDFIT